MKTPFRFEIEPLENRRMLAHGLSATAMLVGQNLALANYPTINGSGESIAILDTGVDYNDPLLGGGFGPHKKVIAGYDFVNNSPNPLDPDGHGTGVAGIIGASPFTLGRHIYEGIAQGVNIIDLRIDNSVSNPTSAIINTALQWVLSHQARYNIVAVNLSEGGNSVYSSQTTGPNTTILQQLQAAGVFVAVAAGNDGTDNGVEYPAADPYAISVGSVDPDGQVSSFSDAGSALDLLAPGDSVGTTYLDNTTLNPVVLYATGTSFSTPFAAAAAALVKQADPLLNPTQILTVLQATATSVVDSRSGDSYPLLNVNNAIDKALHMYRHSQRSDARASNAGPAANAAGISRPVAASAFAQLTGVDPSWLASVSSLNTLSGSVLV